MTLLNENDKKLTDLIERFEENHTLLNKTVTKLRDTNTIEETESEQEEVVIPDENDGMDPKSLEDGQAIDVTVSVSPKSVAPGTIENLDGADKLTMPKKSQHITSTLNSKTSNISPRPSHRSIVLSTKGKLSKNAMQEKIEELEKKNEDIEDQIDKIKQTLKLVKKRKKSAASPNNKKAIGA